MKIWRYEKNGFGPYVGGMIPELWNHSNSPLHPTAGIDFDLLPHHKDYLKFFFGFDSIEKLETWFSGTHELLHSLGFKIFVYEADNEFVHMGKSGRQVIFKKECSRFLYIEDIFPNFG